VSIAGSLTATGDVTAYSSDARLKANVRNITRPVERLKTLSGVTHSWNELAREVGFVPVREEEVGLLAQEVEAVLPEAVALAPFDTDAEGHSLSGQRYLTVRYEKLVPLLVEAIKEQQRTIEAMHDRLAALEV
jgi:hypothetical protein